MDSLEKLTFFEIFLALELEGYSSLRGLATAKGLPVSQVSKTLKKVEKLIGVKLIKRSAKGYSLTGEAKTALETIKNIQKLTSQLSQPCSWTSKKDIFFASRTFLLNAVAGKVSPLFQEDPRVRLGFIDMPSGDIPQAAYNGEVHMALHLEPLKLTEKWVTQEVGELQWCYCVGESYASERVYSLEELVESFEIITPMFWNGTSIRGAGRRGFEEASKEAGYHCTDLLTAVEIVKNTPSVAFLPRLPVLKTSGVAPLKTSSSRTPQKIYLSVDSGSLSSKMHKSLCYVLKESLHCEF